LARPHPALERARPWTDGRSIRAFSGPGFLGAPDERRKALAAVARDGACLLEGLCRVDGAPEPLETIVATFGFIRETNYGRFFDVRVEERAANLAFTDLGLAPHTDNPYREPPPTLQLLHCIETAAGGGDTILVDGFAIAQALRACDPGAFALLASTPAPFAWRDANNIFECEAPVIELNAAGEIAGLRVNDRALRPFAAPCESAQAWRAAYGKLCALIADPARQVRLRLRSGEALIFDNRRILHGRTAYSGGARWLKGCYADRDGLLSALAVLERDEAGARVEAALAPLAGAPGDEAYGEGVSLRAHALQAAALAGEQDLGDALVAAALLHDIGWTIGPTGHDRTGAAMAASLFGERVGQPIRLHVAAKRYLVATEPGYRARLSPASCATLAEQGGPMSVEEARAFEREPGFADAIALRRIDDDAKDPAAATLQLADYRDLLMAFALDALRAEADAWATISP
jgi:gamma-butyrobetaine dioxygenase